MPSVSPRIDRVRGEEMELRVTEAFLYRLATLVDAYTKAGAIYGQQALNPQEAEMKRQAMEGGNG